MFLFSRKNVRCNAKKSGKGNKLSQPWFDEDCKFLVSIRKDDFDKFRNSINSNNKIGYQRCQAIRRMVVKSIKLNTWQTYIRSLGKKENPRRAK